MPGLLTLHTDLKSLKYGHDTPGGGDSGQPYIKTDINTVDTGFNKLRLTRFDDGFIRGGIIGAANAAITDTLRIGKFLTDAPKGPLFIARQIGLQLTNPRIESRQLKTNAKTSGQGFLNNAINFVTNIANKVENAVGPTRIYNLGINTLAQVPVNVLGGHIVRHGFLPNNDSSKYYENVVRENNFINGTDRLTTLTNNFNLGNWGANKPGLNKKEQGIMDKLKGLASSSPFGAAIYGGLNAIFNVNKETEIDSYLGGAGSVYGIGTTTIRRFSDTEDKDKIEFSRKQSVALAGKTRDDKNQPAEVNQLDRFLGASNRASSSFNPFYFTKDKANISNNDDYIPVNLNNQIASFDDGKIRPQVGDNVNDIARDMFTAPSLYPGSNGLQGINPLPLPNLVYPTVADYSGLADVVSELSVNDQNLSPNIGIYKTLVNGQLNQNRLPNKSQTHPTYKNYYGVFGVRETVQINIPWNKVTREKRVGSGRQDAINLTPIFSASAGTHTDTVKINGVIHNINDLVKFRIQAIDTDSDFKSTPEGKADWMIFRAYITDLSDSVDASWNGVKYAGRGDQFYIYDGFTRKMSVTFKVAALSRQEMEPMYQKLNYLMSNLMPDYNGVLMRGPLNRMTIGNWIDGQLCVFNSLSYKIPTDSPWEIGLNDEELILPHIVEVTINFTPIGSQTRNSNELPRKEQCVSNIAQNWNGATEREYIKPCDDPTPPPVPIPKNPDPVPKPNPRPAPKPAPTGSGGGGGVIPKPYVLPPLKLENPSDITGRGGQDERYQQKEQKLKNPDLFKKKPSAAFGGFGGGSLGGGGASGQF